MRTISGSNLNVVVYETVPHLLVTAWYPVICQEIYLNHRPLCRETGGKIRCGKSHAWVEDMELLHIVSYVLQLRALPEYQI